MFSDRRGFCEIAFHAGDAAHRAGGTAFGCLKIGFVRGLPGLGPVIAHDPDKRDGPAPEIPPPWDAGPRVMQCTMTSVAAMSISSSWSCARWLSHTRAKAMLAAPPVPSIRTFFPLKSTPASTRAFRAPGPSVLFPHQLLHVSVGRLARSTR